MKEPASLEAVRSPFAWLGGASREVHPDALLARVLAGLIKRTGVDPEQPENAVNGAVTHTGERGSESW